MMKVFFKVILYILLIIFFALSIYQLGETFYYYVFKDYKAYMWFGIGMGVYFILRLILNKNKRWFQTFTHELSHTVVGLMFFRKIHSFRAGEGEGEIYHSGRYRKNIFISLAPYCLPIYTYLFCIIRIICAEEYLYIFDILLGFTLAFHLTCFFSQMGAHQTDIREFGLFTSYVFIFAFMAFNVTIVLLTIQMGLIDAFVCQFKNFWSDIMVVWERVKLTMN
ncbi:MAG: hypothetical protein LBP67_06025 [Bacteroidales bacterium]|nr:hypothetical protein [Bacteroidales bacterium]